MHKPYRGLGSIVVLVLPAMLCLALTESYAEEVPTPIAFHQSMNPQEAVKLDVNGDLGADIRVIGTQGQTLELAAMPKGSFAANFELKHWRAPDGLHVSFDLAVQNSIRRWLHAHDTHVKVIVHLPRAANLAVDIVNGPVDVENVVAPVTVRLVNGPITLNGSGAALSLRTVNGPIDVDIADISRVPDISLNVTNGAIDVSVPRGFAASVEAHTVIGSVDDGLASHSGPGRLEANVVTGAITLVQR